MRHMSYTTIGDGVKYKAHYTRRGGEGQWYVDVVGDLSKGDAIYVDKRNHDKCPVVLGSLLMTDERGHSIYTVDRYLTRAWRRALDEARQGKRDPSVSTPTEGSP